MREALSDAWDPDDPLGLKENGFSKDDLNLKDEAPKRNGSSATSAAKPATASGDAKATDSPTGTPAFDPDAT